jgi:2-dehydro-3-deoxyphosphogluconate aldolase / (4S)-4-hydroxy-2-oxoglutarate aldolase
MNKAQFVIGENSAESRMQVVVDTDSKGAAAATLSREEVSACIEKIGVLPAVRLGFADGALLVAEALAEAGIPLIEISMSEPGALDVISYLANHAPKMIVGAGGIFGSEAALRCVDAGAKFLTSDVFVSGVVELAAEEGITVIPSGFTPTEIATAWSAGADFVKVNPCDAAGGHTYIRSLKAALPQVRLIPVGGVNQQTALDFIRAGATALGVSNELIPEDAIWLRQSRRIQELGRRFLGAVNNGRN